MPDGIWTLTRNSAWEGQRPLSLPVGRSGSGTVASTFNLYAGTASRQVFGTCLKRISDPWTVRSQPGQLRHSLSFLNIKQDSKE